MIKLCDEAESMYIRVTRELGGNPTWIDAVRARACEEIGRENKYTCRLYANCYRTSLKMEVKKDDKKSKND